MFHHSPGSKLINMGPSLAGNYPNICDSGDGWEGGVNSPLSMINPTPSVADKMENQELRRAS